MNRKIIIGFVIVLVAIGAGYWWFMQPAPAPVKVAVVSATSNPAVAPASQPPAPPTDGPADATPPPATANISTPAQNKGGIYPGFGPQDAVPTIVNPQADLSTALPDFLRILKTGDFMTLMRTYAPPNEIAEMTPDEEAHIQANLQNPEAQQELRSEITAMEYAQTQTPVLNADGNTATYHNVPNPEGGPGRPTRDIVWVKENGQWYLQGF